MGKRSRDMELAMADARVGFEGKFEQACSTQRKAFFASIICGLVWLNSSSRKPTEVSNAKYLKFKKPMKKRIYVNSSLTMIYNTLTPFKKRSNILTASLDSPTPLSDSLAINPHPEVNCKGQCFQLSFIRNSYP